jgi:cob(I)alamin adenosyltransferase
MNVGSGDRGMTSLLSGERVPKSDARVDGYGEVDELSSVLGALAAALPESQGELRIEIQRIQGELFNVGALIAAGADSPARKMLHAVGSDHTKALEDAIDRLGASLPPLRNFLLPGGHPTAAWAHVARTVCRRAERRLLELASSGAKQPGVQPGDLLEGVLAYMNRLSTYLYVLARFCNAAHGIPDMTWKG